MRLIVLCPTICENLQICLKKIFGEKYYNQKLWPSGKHQKVNIFSALKKGTRYNNVRLIYGMCSNLCLWGYVN